MAKSVEMIEKDTVTSQLTKVDKTFLLQVVKNKDAMSKSEAIRRGLALLRSSLGYSEKTGEKEAA